MAKTVQDITIKLGVQGLEQVEQLKSVFKNINASVAPASQSIDAARKAVIEWGRANVETERSLSTQINSLKQLRSQAEIGGSSYNKLTNDISRLNRGLVNSQNVLSNALGQTSRAFTNVGASAATVKRGVDTYSTSFTDVRAQVKETVSALRELVRQQEEVKRSSAKGAGSPAQGRGRTGFGALLQAPNPLAGPLEIPRKGLADIQAVVTGLSDIVKGSDSAVRQFGLVTEAITGVGAAAGGIKVVTQSINATKTAFDQLPAPLQFIGTSMGKLGKVIGSSLYDNVPFIHSFSAGLSKVGGVLDFTTSAALNLQEGLSHLGPTGLLAAGGVAAAAAIIKNQIDKNFESAKDEAVGSLTILGKKARETLISIAEFASKYRISLPGLKEALTAEELAAYADLEARRRPMNRADLEALKAQATGQFAATPAGATGDVAARRSLNTVMVMTEQLNQIELEQAAAMETARQAVRGNEKSIQALSERIAYLNTVMQSADRSTTAGATAFAQAASESRSLKNEIDQLANSYRHVSDMATQAATAAENAANAPMRANYMNRALVRQQEAAMVELGQRVRQGMQTTTLALPAAGTTSAPQSGANIGGGARYTKPNVQRVAELSPGISPGVTGANINTAAIFGVVAKGLTDVTPAADRASRSLRDIYTDITRFEQAGNGSIASLQRQRTAWTELRSAVNPAAPAFKTASSAIDTLDAKLTKLSATRNKLSAGQAVQAAGAVISGGIFGGPEGFLGGLGGAALGSAIPGLGTVGGAFAGSAAGAQLGQFRQQITGATDYAAQIQKLQISLRGVAGSQDEYNRAIAASQQVTKDYNVSQLESLTGFTKLTASIKGAGGNVADSELIFRNVTAAIKATGGGAEQVQGALLAMSQIFSKGKVSAEELNQIGERLPGTFSLFAAAAGKTGPALQDGLKKGTVGLADVMKFADLLGKKYTNLAQLIADSSVDAGLRAQIAFQNMQLEVGKALQPIGAQFQDAFAKFLYEITPAVVSAAKGLAAALKFISDNIELLKGIGSVALEIGKVMLAFKAAELAATAYSKSLALIKGLDIASTLATTAGGIKITGDVSAAAATKVGILSRALQGLLKLGVVYVAIDLAIKGFERFMQIKDAVDRLRGYRIGDVVKSLGGTAQTKKVLQENLEARTKGQNYLQTRVDAALNLVPKPLRNTLAGQALADAVSRGNLAADKANIRRLNLERADLARAIPMAPAGSSTALTPYEKWVQQMQDDTKKKKTGGKGAANAAAREAASDLKRQLDLQRQIFADSSASLAPILATKNKISQIDRDITKAAADGNGELAIKLERTKLELQLAFDLEGIEKTRLDALRKNADDADQTNRKLADQSTNTAAIKDTLIAINKLRQDNLDLTAKETALIEAQNKSYAQSLQDRQRELGLMNKGDYNKVLLGREKERVGREYGYLPKPQQDQMVDLYRQQIEPTFGEGITQQLSKAGDQLTELLNPINQVVTAAESIGSAFSNSFTGIISGTMTAKEALASFFQSVAKSFLDMASQIIAKWIFMTVLNTVLKLFPGGGNMGGGNYFDAKTGKGIAGPNFGFANGGIFAANGIVPYAMGGIVTSPTLFKFANGGAMRTGLMAEAGPEAILPLQRGPNGKLGVMSSGGGGSTSVVVNVDASGSKVEGDTNRAKQLGQAMSAAVQAELIKQKRPGGLLA